MLKILVLGHKGMLGNAVRSYLTKTNKYDVLITDKRYGDPDFETGLKAINPDVIINCIGAIPQRKPAVEEYKRINIDLPIFLESLRKKVVHPTTDCEFSGSIPVDKRYSKTDNRDAADDYGKSKATISRMIEDSFRNTKMIRTSIIGHELASHVSLLDWFLNSEGKVSGYTNHYWNGITTLEWAKLCESLIDDWDNYPVLNQYGTSKNKTKFELLQDFSRVYGKDLTIAPYETDVTVNKCLESDKELPALVEQLAELKTFYGK